MTPHERAMTIVYRIDEYLRTGDGAAREMLILALEIMIKEADGKSVETAAEAERERCAKIADSYR